MYKINDVKYKVCLACLSSDRELFSIDEYIDIFNTITNVSYNAFQPVSVCWECLAILKKIKLFKTRVEEAQSILSKQLIKKKKSQFKTLSRLTTTYTDNIILITHDENIETKQQVQIKEEINDDIDVYDADNNVLCLEEIKKENTIDKKVKKERTKNKNYKLVSGVQRYKFLRKKVSINPEDIQIWLNKDRNSDFYKNFKFQCTLCIHSFSSKDKLKAHILKYHDESLATNICTTCNSRFSTESALCAHMRGHMHGYECIRCGFQCYTRRRFNAHINAHAVVLCDSCDACLPDVATFSYHYKTLHSLYICDQCGKRCKTKPFLERHMSRHASVHACASCPRRYRSRAGLQRHITSAHSPSAAPAYCAPCDRRYRSAALYRRHLTCSAAHAHERDNQTKKFLCPECGNSYSRRVYMMNHYQHVHMKQSKHYCSHCDKHFLNRTRYLDHMRYHHEGVQKERNKLCNICGRGFAANRTLMNHIRTHSGERPYECEYCSAKFTQRTSMLTHIKYIHLKSKRKVQWQ